MLTATPEYGKEPTSPKVYHSVPVSEAFIDGWGNKAIIKTGQPLWLLPLTVTKLKAITAWLQPSGYCFLVISDRRTPLSAARHFYASTSNMD